ncbi:hypothetical protein [Nocardia sp. alder85J]|uniref:hypothetical protein n=1 Tax=Nocardia sp. alder85J TaxID=2862949 RepID=UPI001CD6C562|nr:hypothetical protein [Nocardia sp. alder85J]MCX4099111.1 hypothetical protein [Nocardia sp. alder85J]
MTDENRDRNPAHRWLFTGPGPEPGEQPAAHWDPPRRTRTATRCPSCGHRAATVAEDARMRADIRVLWLHPDPTAPDGVREAYHCQRCQPQQVADTECARCPADGPLLADRFATDSKAGRVPAAAAAWLAAHGWHTGNGPLTCPNHDTNQSYRGAEPSRT